MAGKFYEAGKLAYCDGIKFSDCPHIAATARYEWRQGWKEALRCDPLIEEDERQEMYSDTIGNK